MPHARFARPTNRLEELERFYCGVLGFARLGGFAGHEGFDGVMLGYPDSDWHLEFTAEAGASAPECPSKEHLLVLYFAEDEFAALTAQLQRLGVATVAPHNPYWERTGALTIEDPDGYRVVLTRRESKA